MRRYVFLVLVWAIGLCSFAERRELIGTFGDRTVRAYRMKIPQQAESYYLKVTPTEVVVAGRDESGTFYGEQTLRALQKALSETPMKGEDLFNYLRAQFKDVTPLGGGSEGAGTKSFEVRDWPSVSLRGVIEGFYGNPWSHEDRLRQFEFYGKRRLNIYVYGPKDDPYHRAHWREPYPEAEAARLQELVEAARRNHVQFVWAIHPGGDIQWNRQDSLAVVGKLNLMYDLGIRTFAVFFDDIGGEGARAEKQAGLMNYLTDAFVRKHKDVEPLIICPTQYNKAWSGGDYLSTLGTKMYPEVRIMWTGNSVVDMIERDDMEWINAQIKRKAFIWLNYPVNDYCQSRLLMGKTYGNGLDIADLVSGFCSNPMEYAEASKVSLYSIADYCWNMPAYDAEKSWEQAIDELMPTSKEAFRFFCENNIDLGKTAHGLRREGESSGWGKVPNDHYFRALVTEADALLADSISQPEMLQEIKPWVETMRLLGQSGLQVFYMQRALQQKDSVSFIAHYRALQKLKEKQNGIISRNYEGSVVKAKPVVSGSRLTPWVDAMTVQLVKDYKHFYSYGLEFFPQQAIEDGLYYIMYNGKYLTDVNASPDRDGDYPIFLSEADTINPQRQLWRIELVPETNRFKITNAQDGRYINEIGTFWANKNTKPYNAEWNTYILTKTPVSPAPDGLASDGYTIQCAGRASGSWYVEDDRIKNGNKASTFQIKAP